MDNEYNELIDTFTNDLTKVILRYERELRMIDCDSDFQEKRFAVLKSRINELEDTISTILSITPPHQIITTVTKPRMEIKMVPFHTIFRCSPHDSASYQVTVKFQVISFDKDNSPTKCKSLLPLKIRLSDTFEIVEACDTKLIIENEPIVYRIQEYITENLGSITIRNPQAPK